MATKIGFAARCNGFFLTKKGAFLPLCDETAVHGSAEVAVFEAEKRLGSLLPDSVKVEAVRVSRVWVEA